jgi:hypothetical protein
MGKFLYSILILAVLLGWTLAAAAQLSGSYDYRRRRQ